METIADTAPKATFLHRHLLALGGGHEAFCEVWSIAPLLESYVADLGARCRRKGFEWYGVTDGTMHAGERVCQFYVFVTIARGKLITLPPQATITVSIKGGAVVDHSEGIQFRR
jgi:hypothetical protein